jgi:hypothetical protein
MRDVSKILSDADLLKLRALLDGTTGNSASGGFLEYPKMLFHPEWLTPWRLVKDHPDPLVRKEAQQKLPALQVIVHDIEMEEEYLADGWRTDPNEFIVADNEAHGVAHPDPRVPKGREGRLARKSQAEAADLELANLRRRYAELTGRRLLDEATTEDEMPLAATAEPQVSAPAPRRAASKTPTPARTSKREQVAQAARRAASARA